jgi:hypothetical protein
MGFEEDEEVLKELKVEPILGYCLHHDGGSTHL